MELTYPVIISKHSDKRDYYIATSPIFPSLKVKKYTLPDVTFWTGDEIAAIIEKEREYPKTQDPTNWRLKSNEQVIYLTIDI